MSRKRPGEELNLESKKWQRKAQSSSDSSDSSSDDEDEQEVIETDFAGRWVIDEDQDGIRQLLGQLFLKAHVDLSKLAEMLISQSELLDIGITLDQVQSDDDECVFGITSVVNISKHKEEPCIQNLVSYIQDSSKKNATALQQEKITSIMSENKIGLLINERYINIPAKIADPLLQNLINDLNKKVVEHPEYDFDYIVMICKLHKPKKGKGETIFSNPEEEVFAEEAEVSFVYNVVSECDSSVGGKWTEDDVEMVPYRQILFIKGDKLNDIVQKVKTFIK